MRHTRKVLPGVGALDEVHVLLGEIGAGKRGVRCGMPLGKNDEGGSFEFQ